MWIFVGLGNPGRQYRFTRHNAGWMAVEEYARKKGLRWLGRDSFVYAQGDDFVLVKPVTYMNLSGKAVKQAFSLWGEDREKLVVIHDDIDLPLGSVKLKLGGGTGGHRGLESVMEAMGTSVFGRIRIGINIGFKPAKLADFVLQEFGEEEREPLLCALERTSTAMDVLMEKGWERAMNEINGLTPCSFQEKGAKKPQGGETWN